jgi:hypothetical protein
VLLEFAPVTARREVVYEWREREREREKKEEGVRGRRHIVSTLPPLQGTCNFL